MDYLYSNMFSLDVNEKNTPENVHCVSNTNFAENFSTDSGSLTFDNNETQHASKMSSKSKTSKIMIPSEKTPIKMYSDKKSPLKTNLENDRSKTVSIENGCSVISSEFSAEKAHTPAVSPDFTDKKVKNKSSPSSIPLKCKGFKRDSKMSSLSNSFDKNDGLNSKDLCLEEISTLPDVIPQIDVSETSSSETCSEYAELEGTNETNFLMVHSSSDVKVSEDPSTEEEFVSCSENPSNNVLLHEENITRRSTKPSTHEQNFSLYDISLLHALDLHDSSLFLNESVIQSTDSLLSLNLCSPDRCLPKACLTNVRNEDKETHVSSGTCEMDSCSSPAKETLYKINDENKAPRSLKQTPSKTSAKRTTGTGTKIPIRKFDITPQSMQKIKPLSVSVEKDKKYKHSPYQSGSDKKLPVEALSGHKSHHYCKVRNTIFSKVPQITPSKKYLNIQSPVGQYIRSGQVCGSVKTPVLDPILRDCMNDIYFHQQLESPFQPPAQKKVLVHQPKRKA